MTTRRIITTALGAAATSLLAGCGTIIYPDRVDEKKHGSVDPLIVGLDAVGLLFFLIPGIVAFVVDFSTGAIYFPEGQQGRGKEEDIFDKMESTGKLRQRDIERMVGERTGVTIDLDHDDVRAMRLDRLDQFRTAKARLSKSRTIMKA